jgi:hypothetical protein
MEPRKKAVTVHIHVPLLQRLMKLRKVKTQSELINTLLAEEEERMNSHSVLRATAGTVKASSFVNRLL